MQPGDHERDGLLHARTRAPDPEIADHVRVAGLAPRHGEFDACPDNMADQQERQGEAEDELCGFPGRHPQGSATEQRLQGEREVNAQ